MKAGLARAAGIEMPETRLLETKSKNRSRWHFATKRFDREGSLKIHHHTLANMIELGAGDIDYKTLLRVTKEITKDEREVWKAFRRAAFNVLSNNRDDHGKNHGFLYRDRNWSLGPAYDLTFTQNPMERGMAVMGERKAAGVAQLLDLAKVESLDRHRAREVLGEVSAAIHRWAEFADEVGVPSLKRADVAKELRRIRSENALRGL